MPKTDSARKEYLNQFFGSKRYLYQDNERVAHIHVVNDTYYFHGHIVPGWQGVKRHLIQRKSLKHI